MDFQRSLSANTLDSTPAWLLQRPTHTNATKLSPEAAPLSRLLLKQLTELHEKELQELASLQKEVQELRAQMRRTITRQDSDHSNDTEMAVKPFPSLGKESHEQTQSSGNHSHDQSSGFQQSTELDALVFVGGTTVEDPSPRTPRGGDESSVGDSSVAVQDQELTDEKGSGSTGNAHLIRAEEMCKDFAETMGWSTIDNRMQKSKWRNSLTTWAPEGRPSDALTSLLDVHSSFAEKIVERRAFTYFFATAVFVQSALLGASVNWAVTTASSPDDLPLGYRVAHYVFTFLFTLEAALRIAAAGSEFFCGTDFGWNWFDLFVLCGDVADTILLAMEGSSSDIRMFRMLRIAKMGRATRGIRAIRVMRFFRELRMLVFSILRSCTSVAWAMGLFFIIIYVFSVYLMQQVAYGLSDHTVLSAVDHSDRKQLEEDWGSLVRSWYTLFAAMTNGKDWTEITEPLSRIHISNALVMCFFIFFQILVVANIVTGIFVENAMQSAQKDQDIVIQEQMLADDHLSMQIREILRVADTDHSGTISLEEFEQLLKTTEVRTLLKSMGIQIDKARGLFKLLDIDHSRAIGIEEFVYGCIRLKGNAKSIDLATLMYENKRLVEQFRVFFEYVREGFERLDYFEVNVEIALDALSHGAIGLRRQERSNSSHTDETGSSVQRLHAPAAGGVLRDSPSLGTIASLGTIGTGSLAMAPYQGRMTPSVQSTPAQSKAPSRRVSNAESSIASFVPANRWFLNSTPSSSGPSMASSTNNSRRPSQQFSHIGLPQFNPNLPLTPARSSGRSGSKTRARRFSMFEFGTTMPVLAEAPNSTRASLRSLVPEQEAAKPEESYEQEVPMRRASRSMSAGVVVPSGSSLPGSLPPN